MNELLDFIVEDADDKPKEVKPEKLSQAKTRLVLYVEESLYVHIEQCTSALQIWKKLKNLFEDSSEKLVCCERYWRYNWKDVRVCKNTSNKSHVRQIS